MSDKGSYTNYSHGDLGDETPGYDPDFPYPHLDPEELGDLKVEGEDTNNGSDSTNQ